MIDFIVLLVIALIVGGASLFIYKEKKRGVKCIGCPYAESCAKKQCGCHSENN